MNYKNSIILVTTLFALFTLIIIQTTKHPFEYVVVDDVKIEAHRDYQIEENGNHVYLYLPINFDVSDVEINVYVDDEQTSSYAFDKVLNSIDCMIPQEVIEDILVDHHLVTLHIIVQ